MENKSFTCPHCGKKQQLKNYFSFLILANGIVPIAELRLHLKKRALYTALYMEFLVRFLPLFQQIIVYTC